MDTEKLKQLLQKQKSGQLTDEEKAILDAWYLELSRTETADVDETDMVNRLDAVWAGLDINKKLKRATFRLNTLRIAAAASVLLFLSAGAYFAFHKHAASEIATIKPGTFKNDINPGSNNAILTLSGGKQIVLKNVKNGLLARQGASQVQKAADGELKYETAEAPSQSDAITYNTVTTKRGNKYDVTLPDGTVAYLDAASSIHFPTVFSGNSRGVSITGQVYFEVAHDKTKPFRVMVKGETVEVLGTHFNINAYDDEPAIKTTLLEGSVKISDNGQSALLVPGQQAQITNDKIVITRPDVEEVMAWKNGLFQFNNTDLQTAMRQLSRWYDVDVVYQGNAKNYHFGGFISRDSKLSEVLRILQLSGVNFSIDGKKIIVYE